MYLEASSQAIAQGIVFGNTDALQESVKDMFRNVGMYHVLAASGMHLSIVFQVIQTCLRPVSRRYLLLLLTIIGLIFYACLADFSTSILRALFCTVYMLIASKLLHRSASLKYSLGVCSLLLIVTSLAPWDSVSLQLSASAVLGICFYMDMSQNAVSFENHFTNAPVGQEAPFFRYIIDTFSLSACILLFISPLLAYYFHEITIVGLLSNLVLVWFIPVILILGFVYFSLESAAELLPLELVLNLVILVLGFCIQFFELAISLVHLHLGGGMVVFTPGIPGICLYYLVLVVIWVRVLSRRRTTQTWKRLA